MRTKTKTSLDYLIDMGRTFRRDDDHNYYGSNRSGRPKKNKPRKQKKNFSDKSYNVAETYEDHYGDQGFEKFDYAKRKGK
jgi:hypothetical protein